MSSFSARHREESWRRTLDEAGIEAPTVLHGDWSTESGYQVGMELGRNREVTAIFAANDQMALGGAMRAYMNLGASSRRMSALWDLMTSRNPLPSGLH